VSMASAATSVRGRWPHRRILLALLVVSLVLNIFFIAGAVWTRMHPPAAGAAEQRLKGMAAGLDLDANQRAAFERYASAMRTRGDKLHQQVAPLIGSAWEEIAKPQADARQVMRLFDDAAVKRQESQHEAAALTLEFLATLSPDQRRKFVTAARERYSPRRDR
jgi:uncharacterized membrane protein